MTQTTPSRPPDPWEAAAEAAHALEALYASADETSPRIPSSQAMRTRAALIRASRQAWDLMCARTEAQA